MERATRAAMIAGIVADYPDWHDAAPDAEALRVEADTNKRVFSRCFGHGRSGS